MSDNNKQELSAFSTKHYIQIVVTSLLCIIIVAIVLVYSNAPIKKVAYSYIISPLNLELSTTDNQTIEKLIQNGKIISIRDVYSDTLSYYNTLLTLIIIGFSIMGYLAVIHIRTMAKEEVEKDVERYFKIHTESSSFRNEIETLIQENLETYSEQIETNQHAINQMKEYIELLNKRVSQNNAKIKDDIDRIIMEKNNGKN